MGIYINVGNAGFQSVLNGEYVDKSGLITVVNKTLYTESRFSCVSRCRRYATNDYIVHRELPTGKAAIEREQSQVYLNSAEREQARTKSKGFADLVLIPRKNVDSPALVLELKVDKTADAAIDQIRRRQYPEKVQQYIDHLLLVGINYDRDTKQHTCQIETL